jgi:hypothetical protein
LVTTHGYATPTTRRDDEQAHTDQREPPPADDRRHEEEDGDDRGRDGDDREAGDDRVVVDVARAGDAIALLRQRLVAVEPDAHALHEQVEAREHRELDARGLRDAQLALPDAHRSVQIGDERRQQQRDEQHGRREPEHGTEERQREQVEPVSIWNCGSSRRCRRG